MAEYQSALIQGLRQASPGVGSNNPGVRFLANQGNGMPLNMSFGGMPSGLINNPTRLEMPAYVAPVRGAGDDLGSPGFMPDRGLQFDLPALDQLEPDVPDYTEDLWPPVDEPVAESFPVPDPSPIEVSDLPPLDPVAEPFPVPDPVLPEIMDLPPLPDEPQPEPQDPPQGELEVGPPGDSQPARDAIDQIGDITEVGDPLDEWDMIELPVPDLPPPPMPEPEPDPVAESFPVPDQSLLDFVDLPPLDEPVPPAPQPEPVPEPSGGGDGGGGGVGDVYIPPTITRSVSPDPLDEWDEIELPEPEIPLPEIPAASFSMSDAALLDMLMGLDMSDMDVSYMNF